MDSLTLLIPIAFLFTVIAIAALFWAIRSGQFDDLDRAARDILFDDEPPPSSHEQPDPAQPTRSSSDADKPGND